MALINTQPFGMMKPSPRITARNAHLIPEIYLRAKRTLHSAKEETVMANSVVRRMAELWIKKKTGEKCTCTETVDNNDECNCKCKGAPDIAEFIKSGNLRILNSKEFCPLCYGSGYIGGYDLQGTTSVVLHARNNPNLVKLKLSDGLSIKKGSPYTILCGTHGKATWTFDLPRYFLNTHTIVLYWRPRPPKDFKLYLNKEEFNLDVFNTLGQIRKPDKVSITLEIEDTSGKIELFYLRFFLKTSKNTLVSVDIPNYTYSYTGELSIQNENQSSITANFDGSLGKIDATSVFILQDDGIAWRVIENEFYNPLGVNVYNATQARLIRSYEQAYIMPSKAGLNTYPLENFTFLY